MLKINGIIWRVYLCSPYDPILRKSNGDYAVGVCDSYEKIICISDDLSLSFTRKVLCHEITHAAMFSHNVFLDAYQEELVADLFASYAEEILCLTNKLINKKRETSC